MTRAPDRAAMEAAVAAFLQASGVDLADPELASTPRRVTDAWVDEFLVGYRTNAGESLGDRIAAAPGAGAVLLTGIEFVGVCPHHLLPYRGRAHVAYQPTRWIVGLGHLATLVDTLSRRLTLQETLGEQLAEALRTHLEADGAAVVLDAQQSCLCLRGERRPGSVTTTEACLGQSGPRLLELVWKTARFTPFAP